MPIATHQCLVLTLGFSFVLFWCSIELDIALSYNLLESPSIISFCVLLIILYRHLSSYIWFVFGGFKGSHFENYLVNDYLSIKVFLKSNLKEQDEAIEVSFTNPFIF